MAAEKLFGGGLSAGTDDGGCMPFIYYKDRVLREVSHAAAPDYSFSWWPLPVICAATRGSSSTRKHAYAAVRARTAVRRRSRTTMRRMHSGMEFTDPDLGIPNRVLKAGHPSRGADRSIGHPVPHHPVLHRAAQKPLRTAVVIAQARSGSGKSAAFVTGLLSILEDQLQGPQAIILAPTRELVLQTYDWMRSLGRDMGMTTEQLVTLGLPHNGRFLRQRVTAQVVVGTPATVSNVLGQAQTINATAIERAHPRDASPCRFALFRARFSPSTLNRVRLFVPPTLKSEMIKLADNEVMVDEIAQLYVDLRELTGGRNIWREDAQRMKEDFVQKLLTKRTQTGKVIIFVQSRHGCPSLAARLSSLKSMKTSEIHGGLDPGQRDEYFDLFMMGNTNILLATDVLARGVDISGVGTVINFDMPYEEGGRRGYVGESTEEANATEMYVHRIGRTGRFGATAPLCHSSPRNRTTESRYRWRRSTATEAVGSPSTTGLRRMTSARSSARRRCVRRWRGRETEDKGTEAGAGGGDVECPTADAMANKNFQDLLPPMPTAARTGPIPPTPTPM